MMKTLMVFYSYTGHTKALAREQAAKEGADLQEIKDAKRPGKLKAYSLGCFKAMGGKPWAIQPMEQDLSAYDPIFLCSPVWAGNPPPAVHAFLEQLPAGKKVKVTMVSASGKSSCREKLEAVIQAKDSALDSFEDVQIK